MKSLKNQKSVSAPIVMMHPVKHLIYAMKTLLSVLSVTIITVNNVTLNHISLKLVNRLFSRELNGRNAVTALSKFSPRKYATLTYQEFVFKLNALCAFWDGATTITTVAKTKRLKQAAGLSVF